MTSIPMPSSLRLEKEISTHGFSISQNIFKRQKRTPPALMSLKICFFMKALKLNAETIERTSSSLLRMKMEIEEKSGVKP